VPQVTDVDGVTALPPDYWSGATFGRR
jgi:hypothetical protein